MSARLNRYVAFAFLESDRRGSSPHRRQKANKSAKKPGSFDNVLWSDLDAVRCGAAVHAGDFETVRAMAKHAPSWLVVSSLSGGFDEEAFARVVAVLEGT